MSKNSLPYVVEVCDQGPDAPVGKRFEVSVATDTEAVEQRLRARGYWCPPLGFTSAIDACLHAKTLSAAMAKDERLQEFPRTLGAYFNGTPV